MQNLGMPRGPRISYPGAVLHVLNRFVDRHPFFRCDADYEDFLEIFFQEAETFRMSVFAYDLLPNHFHIVLQTHTGEISKFLQRFLSRAAQALNRSWDRTGHVFEGRAKTLLVETDLYFGTIMGYVLLNRVRARLAKSVFSDAWNSVGEMLSRGKSEIDRERLWPYLFGHSLNRKQMDRELALCREWLMEIDPVANESVFRSGHRGSFLGSREFRERTLAQQERRRLVKDSSRRRKKDRDFTGWTREAIQDACTQAAAGRRGWEAWRSREKAIRDMEWFILYTKSNWSLEKIRSRILQAGTGHSRISMAISNIRRNSAKFKAVKRAYGLLNLKNPEIVKLQV